MRMQYPLGDSTVRRRFLNTPADTIAADFTWQGALHLMELTNVTPPGAPPGLTAAIVYLRPVARAELLGTMANLGIFVREYQSLPVIELWNEGQECDLAVMVGSNDPAHIAAAHRICAVVTPAAVAVVPNPEAEASYRQSGVIATVIDSNLHAGLVPALGLAAQRARSRQRAGGTAETVFVGPMRFSLASGRLECNGRATGLSQVERKVLRRLTVSPGVPVSAADLEQEVARNDAETLPRGSELRATVLRIRRKIEQVGANPLMLGTVRGFGYVLVP